MQPSVSAVIVTHHPGHSLAETVAALMPQTGNVYIVDNASNPEEVAGVKHIAAAFPGRIFLQCNAKNIGLAAAQNMGIRRALADGAAWVLLLDDDSVPQPDMVAAMLAACAQHGDPQVGIVAPRIVEQNISKETRYLVPKCAFGFTHKSLANDQALAGVAMVIASGSLIRADLFRNIGLMAEGYFIDSVDHEFCLRARSQGYAILVAGKAELLHRQGQKRKHGPVVTAHYSPMRRYYMFRNRLYLLRRYGRIFPFLFAYEGMACLWDLWRIVCLEAEKTAKLRAAVRGIRHGLAGSVPNHGAVTAHGN